MKKRILSIIMAAIFSIGGSYSVLAQGATLTVQESQNDDEINSEYNTDAERAVLVNKKEVERYNSEEALILFDENEFKLAYTLNNAINDYLQSVETEMSKNYKMNASAISHECDIYQRIYETNDFISVVFETYTYTGGAHGMTTIKSFVGYKNGDELLSFDDLVSNKSIYRSKLKQLIKMKINLSGEENYYQYYESAVDNIDIDDRFYVDDEGNIVIYYQPYDIAPYAGGIKTFKFSPKELNGIISQEVYYQLKNTNTQESYDIIINGEKIDLKNDIINIGEDLTDYIPVREVLELLGCEVTWNENDGIIVSNIKTIVNPTDDEKKEFTYELDGSNIFASLEPLSIVFTDDIKLSDICSVENVKGVSYITFSDFKKLLTGGAVAYDIDDIINIYY